MVFLSTTDESDEMEENTAGSNKPVAGNLTQLLFGQDFVDYTKGDRI